MMYEVTVKFYHMSAHGNNDDENREYYDSGTNIKIIEFETELEVKRYINNQEIKRRLGLIQDDWEFEYDTDWNDDWQTVGEILKIELVERTEIEVKMNEATIENVVLSKTIKFGENKFPDRNKRKNKRMKK